MVNLRLQKRLAASVLKCGRRKIWLDPNEMNEVGMANTRTAVRKLIRDGFIIKKPQKIHSRFRARQRAIEKKKGRHLGHGSRKGTRNARCSTKMLWIKRQRAMRRLLLRYKLAGKIDRRMYHRYYLKAKGNSFKNKANLIEHIEHELEEKKRNQRLLEQYKIRREEALARKLEKERKKQKLLDEQLKLAEEAEQIRVQQEELAKAAKQKGKGKGKGKGKTDEQQPAVQKKRRRRAKKGGASAAAASSSGAGGGGGAAGDSGKQSQPKQQQQQQQSGAGDKPKRRRRKKGGGQQ